MDNVRNLVGNPIAGIDPEEIVDTRPYCHDFTAKLTNNGKSPLPLSCDKKVLANKISICPFPPPSRPPSPTFMLLHVQSGFVVLYTRRRL
jgi:hypothetical protein